MIQYVDEFGISTIGLLFSATIPKTKTTRGKQIGSRLKRGLAGD
jgi:hypothetical protein